MSDDKRDEATDEDSDLSCDHGPRMLLKTQPEMENETFDGGQVTSSLSCNTWPTGKKLFFLLRSSSFFLVSVVI